MALHTPPVGTLACNAAPLFVNTSAGAGVMRMVRSKRRVSTKFVVAGTGLL